MLYEVTVSKYSKNGDSREIVAVEADVFSIAQEDGASSVLKFHQSRKSGTALVAAFYDWQYVIERASE